MSEQDCLRMLYAFTAGVLIGGIPAFWTGWNAGRKNLKRAIYQATARRRAHKEEQKAGI